MRQIGQRVGAILKADAETVHLLGYGIYDGEHEPPEGPFGMTQAEMDKFRADGTWPPDYRYTNPRITLDNGEQVWGYQCWWASEEKVRSIIGDRRVVVASLSANAQVNAPLRHEEKPND